MPSLTDREVQKLADVIQLADEAAMMLGGAGAEDLAAEIEKRYALRYAVQCAFEACIQIERRPGSGRFGQLFPTEDLAALRHAANAGRHDYTRIDLTDLVGDVRLVLPG